MNGKKINNPSKELKVLIAPLDWGLGHATRCIPIIYTLLKAGIEVILAGDAATEKLLQKEFPTLLFLPLKGYNVTYARSKQGFLLKLLGQVPRIQKAIQYEHRWLQKVVKDHQIDAVISDNRFGLHHPGIQCVYISHQLHIETGKGWLNTITQKIHYRFINRFNQCWVPDAAGSVNLAGKLSHPDQVPNIPVKYLGCLSRFTQTACDKSIPLLVILSGPEPMRSIFEELICAQLEHFKSEVVLVRGLPMAETTLKFPRNVSVHNHLPATDLCQLILSAEMVLARAGYSTIMDLARLGQKAVLVPTPAQAEQEYLGGYLKEQQLFYTCPQQDFNLAEALKEASGFYNKAKKADSAFEEKVIVDWLEALRKAKASQ